LTENILQCGRGGRRRVPRALSARCRYSRSAVARMPNPTRLGLE
jgi:hypothetical protein